MSEELTPAEKLFGADPKPEAEPAKEERSQAEVLFGTEEEIKANDGKRDDGYVSPFDPEPEAEAEDGDANAKDAEPTEEEAEAAVAAIKEDVAEVVEEAGLEANEYSEEFATFAAEYDLDREGAEKLIDISQRANDAAWAQQNENWATETLSDPDWAENVAPAMALIREYSDPELNQALAATGMGNHPKFIKLIAKLSRNLGIDDRDFRRALFEEETKR